jgi:hypothetical protein
MPELNPEQQARRQINAMLTASGWSVQDYHHCNPETIRDHIASCLTIVPEDFDYAPFSQQGGLGKVRTLFGSDLPKMLEELNEILVA